MKYRNRIIYTFGELVKMGINENTLNQYFYGRDAKRIGVKSAIVKIPTKVAYVSEQSFEKYLKKLIKPVVNNA